MIHEVTLFLLFLKASLLSFGGFGPLPLLQQDLVEARHWATGAMIGAALAVGRISPGPNGLFVTSLGYLVGGVPGALAATLAACIPPFLILILDAAHRRVAHLQGVHAVTRGVGMAVVGLIVAVGSMLAQQIIRTPFDLIVSLLSGAALVLTRLDPLMVLLLAALAGIVLR